ncbi:MAG: DUF481 domain-containing protein [Proteobacteria bacterium]|nr:DUF481 domain-containing protein [Pseudomonadota bacterium]NDC23984.1 DUF481 domain-containing protein [Pseudomonadota bacterium]NDD04012.1 DUF481 domain-containing protein [Pseudomonadota bacterium]NDG26238.1 DUF481 domain-containing protein [Pseudomonadota bacterium]
MKHAFVFLTLFASQLSWGDEPKLGWGHESEASAVISSGNADNQTYSLSQKTQYLWPNDAIKTNARYLLGKSAGEETARNWAVGGRYERALTQSISSYLGYQLDSNTFANLDYRHTVDIGGKYSFLKEAPHVLFSELGYRLTRENQLNPNQLLTSHFIRLYTEWAAQWTSTFSTKLYAEYLPNVTRGEDWQLNSEVSANVMLNEVFSLKTGYLFLYRNTPAGIGKKQLDTLFNTALVAKF